VNQVNYNGLATHPVIITAPFGIWFNPIQQHGQEFEENILFNASIMHIDPSRNIPAICAGHIILTFISDTIEPVLTSNSLHPNEPITTSNPSSTHPDPDDELNLLYLTPPPSPVSLTNDQHNDTDYGSGMSNDQQLNLPNTINTTSTVEDEQLDYLYPKPSPPSLTDQPDPDVYYSTTHRPSNQQQSYQHRQLSMHSRQGDWTTKPLQEIGVWTSIYIQMNHITTLTLWSKTFPR
jgi:hypothetical protein